MSKKNIKLSPEEWSEVRKRINQSTTVLDAIILTMTLVEQTIYRYVKLNVVNYKSIKDFHFQQMLAVADSINIFSLNHKNKGFTREEFILKIKTFAKIRNNFAHEANYQLSSDDLAFFKWVYNNLGNPKDIPKEFCNYKGGNDLEFIKHPLFLIDFWVAVKTGL